MEDTEDRKKEEKALTRRQRLDVDKVRKQIEEDIEVSHVLLHL